MQIGHILIKDLFRSSPLNQIKLILPGMLLGWFYHKVVFYSPAVYSWWQLLLKMSSNLNWLILNSSTFLFSVNFFQLIYADYAYFAKKSHYNVLLRNESWCAHFQNYVWDTHFLLSKSSWKPGEQLQAPVVFPWCFLWNTLYEVFVWLLSLPRYQGVKISIFICSLI